MSLLTVAAATSPIALLRFADLAHPERAARRGDLVRVRPGVYAPAHDWRTLPPWSRYLARVHAVALLHTDSVFSHESAAALLGLPVFGDPVVVHILAPSGSTSRLGAGVRVHTSVGDREVVELDAHLTTSPADTAVDLARFRHAAVGLAVADAALRLDASLTVDKLVALNETRVSKRGRALARWPLSAATAQAETALESVSRAVVEWLGLPRPELQATFRSPLGAEDRSDFVWPEIGLAGEADGDLKYDGRFGPPVEILRRQRDRDARLRAHHVKAVAHWGWHEATQIDPVRNLLRGHGLRPVEMENAAQLFTLKRALSVAPPHRTAPLAGAGETATDRRNLG